MPKCAIVFFILVTAVVSGCVSTAGQVKMRPSAYAPVNEQHSGNITYCNAGAQSLRNARREDAYKKIFEACNATSGVYEIVREEEAFGFPCEVERSIYFKCVRNK